MAIRIYKQNLNNLVLPATDGSSYIRSAWNSTPATDTGTSTTMWFDSSGRINWRPDTAGVAGKIRTFDATAAVANTTWTLPVPASGNTVTLAALETAQTFIQQQTNSTAAVYSSSPSLLSGAWLPSVSGVTAISGNGTTVTYTVSNTLRVGDVVTITGATTSAYNLTSVTVASASSTQFTVTNTATGSTSTATVTVVAATTTTTKPHFLIEPAGTTSTGWNTSGTGLGVNAASGFSGNLMDLQVGGTSKFKVSYAGVLNTASTIIAGANLTAVNSFSIGGKAILGVNDLAQLVGSLYIAGTSLSSASAYGTLGFGIGQVACNYTSTIGSNQTPTTIGVNTFGIPTLLHTGGSTTSATNAATWYIAGAPVCSTGVTSTNLYALYVNSGTSYFGGAIAIGNTVTSAVAVASTNKVQISIAGSTYYLLATT